jgi:hypothetical protein
MSFHKYINALYAGLIVITCFAFMLFYYLTLQTPQWPSALKPDPVAVNGTDDGFPTGAVLSSEEDYAKVPEATVPDFEDLSKENQQSIIDGCPWVAGHRIAGPCTKTEKPLVKPTSLVLSETFPKALGTEIKAPKLYLVLPNKTYMPYNVWQGTKGYLDATGTLYYSRPTSIRLPDNREWADQQIKTYFAEGAEYLIIRDYEWEGRDVWRIEKF